jgi:hypothetical protein
MARSTPLATMHEQVHPSRHDGFECHYWHRRDDRLHGGFLGPRDNAIIAHDVTAY